MGDSPRVSISGPPDPAYGVEVKAPGVLRFVMGLLSSKVRKEAKRRRVHYSFLSMKASGRQLHKISKLVGSGAIRPVVDCVFPFAETQQALDLVGAGRVKGKVVIRN